MNINEMKHSISNAIATVAGRRHRLIIIAKPQGIEDKQIEEIGLLSVNINLCLSEKLIDLPINKRSRMVGALVSELVIIYSGEQILAFSKFELLFLPELQQDPVRLFEELSKERTLVIFWPGNYQDGLLSYAEPWHREYYENSDIDAIIL